MQVTLDSPGPQEQVASQPLDSEGKSGLSPEGLLQLLKLEITCMSTHLSYRGQSWPEGRQSCLILGLGRGLEETVGEQGSAPFLSSHQLPHSPHTCPVLRHPPELHLLAICTDMCRACTHTRLAVEIPGNLFLSHTYLVCSQTRVVFMSQFSSAKDKKIQWSYKCVHFEQPPSYTVYITQRQEI